jgi:hypothetical protein
LEIESISKQPAGWGRKNMTDKNKNSSFLEFSKISSNFVN